MGRRGPRLERCALPAQAARHEPSRQRLKPQGASSLPHKPRAPVLHEAASRLTALGMHPLCAGKEAAALEAALGIPVLRHREKKPAGGSEDMEQHFGWGGVGVGWVGWGVCMCGAGGG